MQTLRTTTWILLAALIIATAAEAEMAVRNPKPLQLSEHASAPQSHFNELQKRLDALAPLQSSANAWEAYHLAKAQAWLEASFDLRAQHDSTGAAAQSWSQAQQLTAALEQKNANISRATPLIAGARRVREDLWLLAEKIQTAAGFRCAAARLAQLEVQLVQAGLADQALGWRHAKPYAQAAERLSKDAHALSVACPAPVTKAEELPAEVRAQTPSAQVQTLARRVHFALNSAHISLRSAEVLEQIAFVLRSQPGMVLQLTGHADQRGSASYNQRLSWARARAVRDFLTRSGVLMTQLQVQALGKKVLLSMGKQVMDHARNRRVEFEVRASSSAFAPATSLTEQERDLQPEQTLRSPK